MLESLKILGTPKKILVENNVAYGKAARECLGLLSEIGDNLNSPYYRDLAGQVDRNGYEFGCVWVDGFIRPYAPEYLRNNREIFHTLRIIDAEMATRKLREGLESGSLPLEFFKKHYEQASKILRTELQMVLGVQLGKDESADVLYGMFSDKNESHVGDVIGIRERRFNSGNYLVNPDMPVDRWCGNLVTQQEIQVKKKFI